MGKCRLCGQFDLLTLTDFGCQPMSNHYLKDPINDEFTHAFILSQCPACGTIQLLDPAVAENCISSNENSRTREPEKHLDELTTTLCSLSGISTESVVGGVSYKDDSTLERFKLMGFKNTWRIDPLTDLGIQNTNAGIDLIQTHLNPACAGRILKHRPVSQMIIARHILEHTTKTADFINGLKRLIQPGGYIIFEVPDSTQILENKIYSALWEEHVYYFTPETLRHALAFAGLFLRRLECYPYLLEDSIVVISQAGPKIASSGPSADVLEQERRRALEFSAGLNENRENLKKNLEAIKKIYGRVALYGAGHFAVAFLNLLKAKDSVHLIVDDNPGKRGRYMPGSHLPICGRDVLLKENIKYCLVGVNPENAEAVIRSNRGFTEKGGVFKSIFSAELYL